MAGDDATDATASRLQRTLEKVSMFGQTAAVTAAQQFLMPYILRVFADHDEGDLRRMILSNYPLVEKQTPPGVKRALENLGSNPRLRQQYEESVVQMVQPGNILTWMRTPEDWLDIEEADEQRERLKACADVIEETPGGQAWLEAQVLQVYRYANIVPSTPAEASADD